MLRRSLTSLTASFAAATLSVGLLAVTPGVAQAAPPAEKTTFLGLEGADEVVSSLSDAIRWDLNQRGMDDGNTMSLAELKMTMGCGDGDLACYAEGGKVVESKVLVFGEVLKSGDNYIVELRSLDVATGELMNSINRKVPAPELGETQIGATAASLIDELFQLEPAGADVPPPPDGGGGDDTEDTGEKPPKPPPAAGDLVWGPYSPRPGWKYAGVGISAALMVGGLGTAIAMTIAIGPNGKFRKDLLAAAEASLDDGKPSNDIDPNSDEDLCELAQTPPDPSKPNEVTNAEVTRVCIRGDNMATGATVGWITTGIFAVSTIAFTTLLFVHKSDGNEAVAKLRKHKVRLGVAPTWDGGFMLGGGLRF